MTKSMQGTVVHVNDAKTAKVMVERNWQHPVYKKYVKRTKNYICGIADGLTLVEGDVVVMTEGRPLSKLKRFVITGKVE